TAGNPGPACLDRRSAGRRRRLPPLDHHRLHRPGHLPDRHGGDWPVDLRQANCRETPVSTAFFITRSVSAGRHFLTRRVSEESPLQALSASEGTQLRAWQPHIAARIHARCEHRAYEREALTNPTLTRQRGIFKPEVPAKEHQVHAVILASWAQLRPITLA